MKILLSTFLSFSSLVLALPAAHAQCCGERPRCTTPTSAADPAAMGVLASAQPGTDMPGTKGKQPGKDARPNAEGTRAGDPYPLDTCPISGKKLGSMGEPVVKVYDGAEGREVRFCCAACPEQFEKDLAANLAKIDEKIVKDQGPLYPLKTSVVTGKDLPAKPHEFVHGNRLIRLGAESEKAEFLKDSKKHLADLDKAVIAAQGKDYPLTTCPVSKEKLGGMGEPVDMVVAGRLIRLCCKDCKKEVEKEPARFIAMIDAARKGRPGAGNDEKPGTAAVVYTCPMHPEVTSDKAAAKCPRCGMRLSPRK